MKLERLKSILLVLLVISSIVLTVNKWFNEKLWPEGYNFFSDVKNWFWGDEPKSAIDNFNANEEVLKPAKIIVNNAGKHVLYTKSSPEYQSVYNEIKAILTLSLSEENSVTVTNDEWNNGLKGRSCYFSYPVTYDYGFLMSQISDEFQKTTQYCREFLISYDSRLSSSLNLYVKDINTGEIKKKKINYEALQINAVVEDAALSQEQNYYSFELNFDVQNEDSVDQPIIIDSDVFINIAPKNIAGIHEENVFSDITDTSDICSDILSQFGFNTTTIRKYVENDNSLVYVENYATIKLHTNGLLDYKAIDNSKGIELSGNNSYSSINSCITFVNNVTSSIFNGSEMYYEISSDISDIKSATYTLEFDYYIKDNLIVPENELFNIDHSIIVEVVSGKIVSYKQVCKEYITSEETIMCPSAIDAVDSLYVSFYPYGEKITDIFTAYTYNSYQSTWLPCWYIEKSDGSISMIPLTAGGDIS